MQVARRSRPPPLRIAPFRDAHLDEVRAKAYMAGVEHALRMVWKCQTSELNFSAIYNMAYKLVLWRQVAHFVLAAGLPSTIGGDIQIPPALLPSLISSASEAVLCKK